MISLFDAGWLISQNQDSFAKVHRFFYIVGDEDYGGCLLRCHRCSSSSLQFKSQVNV